MLSKSTIDHKYLSFVCLDDSIHSILTFVTVPRRLGLKNLRVPNSGHLSSIDFNGVSVTLVKRAIYAQLTLPQMGIFDSYLDFGIDIYIYMTSMYMKPGLHPPKHGVVQPVLPSLES